MDELTKKCSKCGETKLLSEYYKRSDCLLGVGSRCKKCLGDYQKANRDRVNEASRKRKLLDPEGEFEKKRRSREKTKEADMARTAKWRIDNPEAISRQASEWRKNNPEAAREISKKYNNKKRSTPKGRLESNISRGVHRGLLNGAKSKNKTFDILPYTIDELIAHLEKLFQPGMSWENYGDWHVDHKVPLIAFSYETPSDPEFLLAWALSNLQPLWAKDNHAKGGRFLIEEVVTLKVATEEEAARETVALVRSWLS